MNGMEITLLIIGVAIFIISFLLPERKGKATYGDSRQVSEEQIKVMVEREIEDAKHHINEIVDETITYAMEKTERSMDRVTNEKMLAVNEYSDTVINEIEKNHREVVFLYDMLNDKHETLKATVSQVTKTASEVKQTVRDAEVTAKEAESMAKLAIDTIMENTEPVKLDFKEESNFVPINPRKVEIVMPTNEETKQIKTMKKPRTEKKQTSETNTEARIEAKTEGKIEAKTEAKTQAAEVDNQFTGSVAGSRNSNERILTLHKAGKSNMAIAKDLGLGIGEVKLVIDLFEGIKEQDKIEKGSPVK